MQVWAGLFLVPATGAIAVLASSRSVGASVGFAQAQVIVLLPDAAVVVLPAILGDIVTLPGRLG